MPHLRSAFAFLLLAAPVSAGTVTRVVPIVLDVTTDKAHYTTELTLTNDTFSPVSISALYTPSLGTRTGGGAIQETLGPGEQKRITDVLSWLRTKGLPLPPAAAESSQGGTLKLDFTGLDAYSAHVWALARTGSDTRAPQPEGRAGTAYIAPLVSVGATLQWVEILVSNENDRSNLGIANFSDQPVTFDVTIHDYSGRHDPAGGLTFSIRKGAQLPAWGWMQIDSAELMDLNGIRAGSATIKVTSGPQALYAYGVINDRVTNDGSILPPLHSPQVNPNGLVPAVETSGFVTELTLRDLGSANPASQNSAVSLMYREALSPALGAGGNILMRSPQYDHVIVDALEAFRGGGMSIGPKAAADYGGALWIYPLWGGWGQARTLTPSPGGGRFGVFTPFVGQADAASDRAAVYGLVSDDLNRSNVAVMNVGDVLPARQNGPITLRLQVHDGASGGAAKGAPVDVTLEYMGWKQFNGILRDVGVTEGWVEVIRLSGSASWFAYGVVNDGAYPGQRTGDGAYIPMAK
ncbi:MAG: hypothetical protein NEA02_04310 [Thermoanaerobaculia bacterium]|nr:hypothetical protein [Thermoanaerobaculia bacterium]